jgi:hypothetical protein
LSDVETFDSESFVATFEFVSDAVTGSRTFLLNSQPTSSIEGRALCSVVGDSKSAFVFSVKDCGTQ